MLCILTHKQHICSGQIRTREAAGFGAVLVMENAREGAQFSSALASLPTHRAPVTAHREERPPSRTQGTFLFAWLPLHNLSEKSTVSPFSLPRGRLWQSMKYCVKRLWNFLKIPGKQFWPKPLSVNLGYALLIWKQEKKKCHIVSSQLLLPCLAYHLPV